MYQGYGNSVGNNFKHVQITTKCRYKMMRTSKIAAFCRAAIEEVCKRRGIAAEIINVQNNHAHLIVDCPRTMRDAKLV